MPPICRGVHFVASFTDAWIETFGEALGNFGMESHLLQMRGLKPGARIYENNPILVASFTDAWIETELDDVIMELIQSRIFYRCVD